MATRIKIGIDEIEALKDLGDLVCEAGNLKAQIDVYTKQYKDINAVISERVAPFLQDTGQLTIIVDNLYKTTVKQPVKREFKTPESANKIMEWLKRQGKEIGHYIKTKHEPTAKLLMLDEPIIFDCVTVEEQAVSFTYEAIR